MAGVLTALTSRHGQKLARAQSVEHFSAELARR